MEILPIPEHKEGNLDFAEKKYLELKKTNSSNNEVNFWLSYLYFQKNDFLSAKESIVEYLKLSDNIKAWNLLGLIYQNLEMFNEAKEAYNKAISINPKYMDARFNLASLYTKFQYFDDAINNLNILTEENPDDSEPFFLLGYCYQQKNNYNLALHFYSIAQSLNCIKPELYSNTANILIELNQFDKAKEYIDDGLNLFPENEDLLLAAAFFYERTNNSENQELILLKLCDSNTTNYIPYFRLANFYKTNWELVKAEACYQKALILSPNNIDILLNYGVLKYALGQFENALQLFSTIINLQPNHLSALNNLANTYLELSNLEEAKKIYNIIFEHYPNANLEHFNYGLALLLYGNLEEGFKHYEHRLMLDEYKRDILGKSRWNGEDLSDKTILIYGEQGIGDIIMFSRFLSLIQNRYKCKIIFECRKEALDLIKLNFPHITVIERGASLDSLHFDFYCSLLSLPLLLKVKNKNDIDNKPYLSADINLVNKWQRYFSTIEGLKIGFVWKGNPFPIEHRKRHTSLSYFFKLTKINNVKLFSLQYGENCSEILQQNGITELVYNIYETAAIIKNLDLVITVDTSIAHLSGALGVNTWVLLTKTPDWRWCLNKTNSYWYNSVRLFRQKNFNNWDEVFVDIEQKLLELTLNNSNPKNINLNELKTKAFSLLENNQFNDSITIYEKITNEFPEDIESYIWLGLAYYNSGDFNNSIAAFKVALDNLNTLPEELYNYYCICFLNAKRYDEGIQETLKGIKTIGNSSQLYNSLGLLYKETDELAKATECLEQAYSLNKNFKPAVVNLATIYLESKNYKKAINFSQNYLSYNPNTLELYQVIGDAYLYSNTPYAAIKYYKVVADLLENHKLYNNYGIALQRIHNYNLAATYFFKAIQNENTNFGYWANLGNNYSLIHNFDKAIECYIEGLKYSPNNKSLISMIGLTKLLTGYFDEGWKFFEASLTDNVPFAQILNCKEYEGENLYGKTILVYSEHGLGDTIQFLRYIPLLKSQGCNIIFEFQEELKPLLFYPNDYYKPIIKGIYNSDEIKCDFYISLLKLPRIFCTNIANIPKLAPNINLNIEKVNKYKQLLHQNKKKIGLVWAGNPNHPNDHNRSIQFSYLKVLFNAPNCHFYLLQKDFNRNFIEPIIKEYSNITDLREELSSLDNLASIIYNLDVIITVDTMIAHLAGTLNKPTYLLLPFLPDWRWLIDRKDSVWYNSITIFRQTSPGDWSTPIEQIYKTLYEDEDSKQFENKINQLINLNKYGEAIELLQNDLTNLANKALLLNKIALVFINQKEYETAISILETALKIDKNNYEVNYNLGYCHHLLNNIEKANEYYMLSLKYNPININTLNNHGLIERDLGNLDYAEDIFNQAITLSFHKPFLHNNLGTINEALGNFELAVENFSTALSIDPNYIDALINLANVYHYNNQSDKAYETIEKAKSLSPDNPTVRFNRALILLRMGKLKEGFIEYEYRIKRPDYPSYTFRKPRFNNLEQIKGKTVLLYDEQGFGDTIQFCRYIKNLKEFGCTIKLLCHPPLVDLMKGCIGVSEVIGRTNLSDSDIQYDYCFPLLSLGMFFEDTLENIKIDVPYILVDHNSKEKWAKEVSYSDRLKIGIVWKGKQTPGNTHRSCELKNFELLFNNNAEFYSLQYDLKDETEINILNKYNINNIGAKIKTFNDTAAIISNLDLIISIDTSVAHLSCALGKQTWILLSSKCDWRWHDFRCDSPWYPTATLFRQKEYNNWNTVFTEVDKKLKTLIN
jgi:tetratricopeptide (TPR) repeat protein